METSHDDKRTDLADVHGVLLEMLKTLAVLFEKNQLHYSLYCGTLLGTIRHRGFIPWDDDVDIVMPLKDYRKFLRIASRELPAGYVIQSPESMAKCYLPYAKVYREGTTMLVRSQAGVDTNWSLSIDIYPMVGGPSASCLRTLQQKLIKVSRELLLLDWYHVTGNYGNKLISISIKKALRFIPHPLRQIAARFFLHLAMYPVEKSSMVGSIDAADFSLKFKRTWWEEMIKAVFEDAEFFIPAEYDKILTVMYGDYMTPPPVAKQYSHGCGKEDIIYDIHTDYKEYCEKILGK